jgi:hypothetical protein
MNLDEIIKLCNDDTVVLTQHLVMRMHERNIKYDELLSAIKSGEIIEVYPNDFPYPSCLILGTIDYPLHIVCGLSDQNLFIITAYKPDPDEWSADFKNRKDAAK